MDGMFGETRLGNRVLLPHGILTETSDIRCHVCPKVRRIYIFPTPAGIEAIQNGNYRLLEGRQEGTDGVTARGYNVPPADIKKCVAIAIAERAWSHLDFQPSDSLSLKGRKALRLAKGMIEQGLFPLPGLTGCDAGFELDIKGMDIIVTTAVQRRTIQVKCDFLGGDPELGGFGLFLQVEECNPLHIF